MDLGIKGRSAIVCAGSRGLGRGCAVSLARNGVDLVINGRDRASLEETAQAIRDEAGVAVQTVAGDISEPSIQAALVEAVPEPDILVNNNGGPPRRDFREIDRDAFIQGVVMNMATPVEMIARVVDGMAARGFGRIVNITSVSVKMPVPGLDLSSGARAGPLRLSCRCPAPGRREQRDDQPPSAGLLRYRAALRRHREGRQEGPVSASTSSPSGRRRACRAKRFGNETEFGEGLRLPLQRAGPATSPARTW